MIIGHRIEKKINANEFLELVGNYSKDRIHCTEHTFFRLSENQRKLYKCDEIKNYLLEQKPLLVGIQYNKNYAVFYPRGNEIIKIILDIDAAKIEIVTFYMIDKKHLPVIK